jgi:hypothetical protein
MGGRSDMSTISREQKQAILQSVIDGGGKYAKPFQKGKLAGVSLFGGNWDEYADIIFSMIMVDTLLNIEAQLADLNAKLASIGSGEGHLATDRVVPEGS